MHSISAVEAGKWLPWLIDQVAQAGEPVLISGTHQGVVLLSVKSFRATQETLCLVPTPGMRESIKEGLAEPPDACATHLEW